MDHATLIPVLYFADLIFDYISYRGDTNDYCMICNMSKPAGINYAVIHRLKIYDLASKDNECDSESSGF